MARKNQGELDGTQADKIPEIEDAAGRYVEARDERMGMTESEVKRRGELEEAMGKHKLTEYTYQDGEEYFRVELKPSEVKAKVRRLRTPADGDNSGDGE